MWFVVSSIISAGTLVAGSLVAAAFDGARWAPKPVREPGVRQPGGLPGVGRQRICGAHQAVRHTCCLLAGRLCWIRWEILLCSGYIHLTSVSKSIE